MIKHYIKIALRSISRQKALAFINIIGLSTGLACFILFMLYAVNEFSFDRGHKKADNIYRMYRYTEPMSGQPAEGDVYLPMPLGPALKKDFPDIENYVRIQEAWRGNFVRVHDHIHNINVSFADPQLFSMFTFPMKTNKVTSPLKDLRDIVITEKVAKQLFGNENPVGQTVDIKLDQDYEPFIVKAVAENMPTNTTVAFDILGNYEYLPTTKNGKRSVDNWNRSAYNVYVQLKPESKLAAEPDRLIAFRKKYYPAEEAELRQSGYWKGKDTPVKYKMQSLRSIHTDTAVWGGDVAPVNPKTIWILLGIAAGLLLIACINFTTLAIGRSAGRAREIGIRKVVGGRRKQLTGQFLSEALLLTIFSVAFGLLISFLLLPWFNQLAGKELRFSFAQFPEMTWLIIGLTLIVGLLAGSYPALILSRFNPIEVLKQKIKVGGSNLFTKSLVTFQFILSIGLIASTIVILQQINFMTGKNPGFNKENVVVVKADGLKTKQLYPLFKQAVLADPGIAGISSSELGIGEGTGWSRSSFDYKGTHKEIFEYYVDENFIPLMSMKILTGRNFNPLIASDTVTSVIINEAAVKDFGWTNESAIGQQLTGYMESLTPVVVGVVKNFNFRPLSEEVKPQMFHQFSDYAPFKFFVRIKPGNPANSLASMQKIWSGLVTDQPFQYSFLNEDLDRFYHSEVRWGKIIGWAGGISIFLASLGLFGLAALSVVNRTKEIGIRKVLGASVTAIVQLLTKDFLKLVFIALIIAAPLAWYFMHQWLQDFAYRISIGWWIFITAGSLSLVIAFLTVGIQAVRAGISNPVKSLRTE